MSSPQPAPDATPPAVATSERALLCDLFLELGPDAPTLIADWDTHHLAAHLVMRERDTVGLVKAALSGTAGSAVTELVRSTGFTELVTELRAGPSAGSVFVLPRVDRVASALEFFVHHEDVRRARPEWTARELPLQFQAEIWSRLRIFAKVLMRRSPVGVELTRTDAGDSSRVAKGADPVVVRGLPSELALFAFGRGPIARVELDGSRTAVAAVRNARFGS